MLQQKLTALAAAHGTSLPDVIQYAGTIKNSKYGARACYVAKEATAVAANAQAALKKVIRIGGKQYKRLAKHNFIIKPKGIGKYYVGKRVIKLKSTQLVTACRHLHAPSSATLQELVDAFQFASNVSVNAFRSNSDCVSGVDNSAAR